LQTSKLASLVIPPNAIVPPRAVVPCSTRNLGQADAAAT
jgi:hypothetical protein